MNTTFDKLFGWMDEFDSRLAHCLWGGCNDWLEGMRGWPRGALAATARSRTSMIVDLVGARLHEAFGDVPKKVRVEREYDTAQLFFPEHNVAVKFNQCDASYRIHAPTTDRAFSLLATPLFPSDEKQLPSGCITLFGVYHMNLAKTALQIVAVTLQGADEVLWKKNLPEPPADNAWAIIEPSAPQTGPVIIDTDERQVENG